MIACGALRDPALLPKYECAPRCRSRASDEATPDRRRRRRGGVGRRAHAGSTRERRCSARSRRRGTPEMRALAVLGLGHLATTSSVDRRCRRGRAKALDAGNVARAAAAYALGELGAESEAPTLFRSRKGDALPRELALVSLARLGADNGEPPAAKRRSPPWRRRLRGRRRRQRSRTDDGGVAPARGQRVAHALGARQAAFPWRCAANAGRRARRRGDLDSFVPQNLSDADRANAVVKYGDVLSRAAKTALGTSSDRARAVLDAIGPNDGSLRPLLAPGAGNEKAHARARQIAHDLEPAIVSIARHPDPTLRMKAVVLLARSASDDARDAMVRAVNDPSETVQRVALASLGSEANPRAVAAVGKLIAYTRAGRCACSQSKRSGASARPAAEATPRTS